MAVIGLAMPPDQKRSQSASTLGFSCGSVNIKVHDWCIIMLVIVSKSTIGRLLHITLESKDS